MPYWNWTARLLAGFIVIGCLGLISTPLPADDNTQAFLDGLRQRELHDIALDLLKTLRDDPKTDKDFRETLDYQFGVTLIGGARELPLEEREKQLDKAREFLEKFLAYHPQHSLAVSASRNLADLKIERGKALVKEAYQPGKTPAEKQRWLERARAMFQEAQKSLVEIDARLVKKKQRFNKIDRKDARLLAQRNQLVAEMILARFALANTYYDLAQTYKPGGKENKTLLREARAKFSLYFWKYNRWVSGYSFRLEQARCYKELGEYDRASEILGALAAPDSDNEEGFRQIRSAATKMALEIYLLPEVKKYKEAWEIFDKWEKSLRRPRRANDVAPEIRYLGGEAALEIARGLGKNDPQQARLRGIYRKRAKELLSLSSRYPGVYQLKARLKLTDPLLATGQVQIETPKSYEEARDRANLAWSQSWQPGLKPKQVERMRAEALVCSRFALAHPSVDAKIDELNTLRFYLAYLKWIIGEYYDAAVLGEFLARRYTDRPEGLRGAKVAWAAYTGLLQDLPSGADRRFEVGRIEDIARFAAEHWPKDTLADDARLTLIRIAVADNDPKKAMELLSHISADSPRRGDAELYVGQALWRAYRKAARLPKQKQPTTAKMTEMLSKARRILTDGVERLRKGVDAGRKVSYPLALGTLSLAQIYLEEGKGKRAIVWLDAPIIGAHTLAKAGSKVVDRRDFRVETFKTALRAYVATEQLQKAEQAMNALEKAAPANNLTNTYIILGRQLEKSLKRLQAKGNRAEADKVARGFELFLTRIANRPANQITFKALNWVAETFVELGNRLAPKEGKLPPVAKNYFRKAALVYGRIVDICHADNEFAPQKGTVEVIQIQLARCLRRLGKYKDAMDLLVEILAVRNNLINAQIEAAYTYQDWGREKPGYYLFAIRGGRKAKQKDGEIIRLVWGWAGIAQKVQFDDSHQDIFNEARYNLAQCRLKYALSLAGQKKVKQLRRAEQAIIQIQRLRPEMGGKKWYNQYDALLRKIQGLLGMKKDQRGLRASENRMSATSK